MEHRVAIWADGHQILNRVDNIGLSDFAHRHNMVNVYEAFSKFSIQGTKVDSTGGTTGTVVPNACIPRTPVSLITIYEDLGTLSFLKLCAWDEFIRKHWNLTAVIRTKGPIYSNRSLYRRMRNRLADPSERERVPVAASIKDKHAVVRGQEVSDGLLSEVRLAFPMPDEFFSIPVVVVIVPCSTRHTYIAEDVVVTAVAVVAIQPITASFRLR